MDNTINFKPLCESRACKYYGKDLIDRCEAAAILKRLAQDEKEHRRYRESSAISEARLAILHVPAFKGEE